MDKLVVGIDLGTTFSAVAYVDDQGRPQVIKNAAGNSTTPSVVFLDGSTVTVGEVAMNQWITNEAHVVRWIKRAMGDLNYRFQGKSAVEISAEILKTLKGDAEAFLGQPIDEAVITCPAYFASVEIENTKKAGELAGLNVREIVKEPTAAAVFYGVENMKDGETVLVCDLGGGTYDATVLSFENGVFIPRASMGDRQLGGHDWTMTLVDMVAEALQQRLGDDPRTDLVAGQMLYEACEEAKRNFSKLAQVTVTCPCQGKVESVTVGRDEFEARTEWRIQQLVMWSEQALAKAHPVLTWNDIDRILLVGGSSRLRRMGLALEERSGKKPIQVQQPDLAVALGAAILAKGKVRPRKPAGGLMDAAGGLVDVEYKRTIPRNMGTRALVIERGTPRITNSLILDRNTESPVSRSRDDFEVSTDAQPSFDVPVVEFEDDLVYDLAANYRFHCLPGARRGDRITVTFHYDISGIVTAEAIDQKSGRKLDAEQVPYEEPNPEIIVRSRPRWVVYAVDTSGSMAGVKLSNAKQALISTARDLLTHGGERCKVGIVSFDSTARVVCQPTSSQAEVERAAGGMHATGTTAMGDGLQQALDLVLRAPAETDRDIVMLTDGMPDSSHKQTALNLAASAASQGVTLSTLGIGEKDVDPNFLKQLSPNTLVIDVASGMTQAMTTLLTQSAAARTAGGLTT